MQRVVSPCHGRASNFPLSGPAIRVARPPPLSVAVKPSFFDACLQALAKSQIPGPSPGQTQPRSGLGTRGLVATPKDLGHPEQLQSDCPEGYETLLYAPGSKKCGVTT